MEKGLKDSGGIPDLDHGEGIRPKRTWERNWFPGIQNKRPVRPMVSHCEGKRDAFVGTGLKPIPRHW